MKSKHMNGKPSRQPGPSAQAGFDDFVRSIGSQATRRGVLKASLYGVATLCLNGLGLKHAFAAASCLCDRELYDSATQCCTPTGVQTKYPAADLARCPNKTQVPGTIAVNGCGAAGGQSFPNSFFGTASFLNCCNNHDTCYGTCHRDNAKNGCDGAMQSCMNASCDAAYPPSFVDVPLVGRVDTNKIKRGTCHSTASAYFAGVQTERWGVPAYNAAQRGACQCCGDEPCRTCPGGTCGALPSCQDPGCVCFQTIEGTGFCHLPQSCTGLASCASSANCPAGWACVSVTCCGSSPICIQPCFAVSGARAQSRARPTGPMTDGSYKN
jgi:hypothetical protein